MLPSLNATDPDLEQEDREGREELTNPFGISRVRSGLDFLTVLPDLPVPTSVRLKIPTQILFACAAVAADFAGPSQFLYASDDESTYPPHAKSSENGATEQAMDSYSAVATPAIVA